MDELLRDVDLDNANSFPRENNIIRLFELPKGESIKDEYVQQLE